MNVEQQQHLHSFTLALHWKYFQPHQRRWIEPMEMLLRWRSVGTSLDHTREWTERLSGYSDTSVFTWAAAAGWTWLVVQRVKAVLPDGVSQKELDRHRWCCSSHGLCSRSISRPAFKVHSVCHQTSKLSAALLMQGYSDDDTFHFNLRGKSLMTFTC